MIILIPLHCLLTMPLILHMLLIGYYLKFSDHSGFPPFKMPRVSLPRIDHNIWLINVDMSETISSFELDPVLLWIQSKLNRLLTVKSHHRLRLSLQSSIPCVHFHPQGTPLVLERNRTLTQGLCGYLIVDWAFCLVSSFHISTQHYL